MHAEHLNHCRQMLKQATDLKVASLPDLVRAQMAHASDLCRASSKFLLPDGGRVFLDKELRGLDEQTILRLPYPFVALEYRAVRDDEEDRKHYGESWIARRRIVFCREDDNGIYITPAYCIDHNGVWVLMGECFVPKTGYLIRDDKNSVSGIKASIPNDNYPKIDYLEEVEAVIQFLNVLQCANAHIEKSAPRKAGKKVKAALPFDVYHILTIDVGRQSEAAPGAGGIGHRSPREHLRRGHIRRLADGRKIWVNATVVCGGRGFAVVKKDYSIRDARVSSNVELYA